MPSGYARLYFLVVNSLLRASIRFVANPNLHSFGVGRMQIH